MGQQRRSRKEEDTGGKKESVGGQQQNGLDHGNHPAYSLEVERGPPRTSDPNFGGL